MLRELNINEMEAVSGGIMGSMYHKDAHDGAGGLYGTGGQLESEYQAFSSFTQANYGVDGMSFLAMSSTSEGQTQLTQNRIMIKHDCEPNKVQQAGFSDWSDHDAFLRDNQFGGRSLRNGDGGSMVGGGILNHAVPGCPDWPSTIRYD